ncbi:hypothetical protein M427DRAFT_57759 [Gonapodya prolifera JEL478]|uniref:VASt domain-containing protein n=1 Tax=Gonapodya prolifera (strain JEL478) TaxID=1344416 RepID=A0A139ACZ3_GONPJ|nr:hypothetical protein M427DRAFT_57759 [Gonapodya prolifera JEL478]|eukprot:KXS14283.1 hypothetical protein M427DRAFT_57759 [Gonapodya prolifera JEL478]
MQGLALHPARDSDSVGGLTSETGASQGIGQDSMVALAERWHTKSSQQTAQPLEAVTEGVSTTAYSDDAEAVPRPSVDWHERTQDDVSDLDSESDFDTVGGAEGAEGKHPGVAELFVKSFISKQEQVIYPKEQRTFDKRFPELVLLTAAAESVGVNLVTTYFSASYEYTPSARGKIYLTPSYFCFFGKSFTRVAKVILPWVRIVSVERAPAIAPVAVLKVASGIKVTDQDGFKYVFGVVMKREKVLAAVVDAWKMALRIAGKDTSLPRSTSSASDLHTDHSSSPTQATLELPTSPLDTSAPAPAAPVSPAPAPQPPSSGFFRSVKQSDTTTSLTPSSLTIAPTTVCPTPVQSTMSIIKDKLVPNFLHAPPAAEETEGRLSGSLSDTPPASGTVSQAQTQTLPRVTDGSTAGKKRRPSDPGRGASPSLNPVVSPSAVPSIPPITGAAGAAPAPTKGGSTRPITVTPPPRPAFPAPTTCGCTDHLAHTVLRATFPTTPRALLLSIFGEEDAPGNGAAWCAAQRARGSEVVALPKWDRKTINAGPEGWTRRAIDYFVKVPMYPRTPSREEQTLVKAGPGLYVVDTVVRTPKVPLGDTFSIACKYCITSLGNGQSQLLVTTKLEWSRRSLLSGQIEKAAIEGQVDYGKRVQTEIMNQLGSTSSMASLLAAPAANGTIPAPPTVIAARLPSHTDRTGPESAWDRLVTAFLDWLTYLLTSATSDDATSTRSRRRSRDGISMFGIAVVMGVLAVACSVTFSSLYWASVTNANLDRTMLALAVVNNNRGPVNYLGARRDAVGAAGVPRVPLFMDSGAPAEANLGRAKVAELRKRAAELHLLLADLEGDIGELTGASAGAGGSGAASSGTAPNEEHQQRA